MPVTSDIPPGSSSSPQESPQSSKPSTPAIHLGYLDGLRALAALFVVLHHMFVHLNYRDFPASTRIFTEPLRFGHYAVDTFIVLSGFCLMLPVARGGGVLRGGAVKFYLKRARRILPPYFLTLAASLTLIAFFIGHKTGTHWDVSLPVTKAGLLSHLFLLQDVFGNTEINHVLWSVSVEWRIYFLFPLLVIAYRKFGALKTTLTTLAATYVVWVGLAFTHLRNLIDTNATGVSPYYLGLFATGMFAAYVAFSPAAAKWRNTGLWGRFTALFAVFVLALSYLPLTHHHVVPQQVTSAFVGCVAAGVLVLVSINPQSWATRALSWRPIVFLGSFAYSLYLFHGPIIQIIWQYAIHPLHLTPFTEFLLMVFPGAPIVVAACYLFFLCCERPFLTKRRNETPGQVERDAALSPAP